MNAFGYVFAPLFAIALLTSCSSFGMVPPEAAPPLSAAEVVPTPAPSEFPVKVMNESTKHWISRWKLFREQTEAARPGGIVLLGDSLTEKFPQEFLLAPVSIHNRGIGGDKVGGWKYYGLIDRLDVSVCGLRPSAVVLMIGVNDIVWASTPWESMEAHYDRLIGEIRDCAPKARLLVFSTLPVRTENKSFSSQILEWNRTIQRTAEAHGAEFINLHPLFLNEEGELRAEYAIDSIHLSEEGYRVWATKLETQLNQP